MLLTRHRDAVRLVATVLLSLVVLAAGIAPVSADAPAPDKPTAKYEVHFLTDMIDHHAMAVMMADMCMDEAVHEELRMMCENIAMTQSQEITTMQTWLQDWYGLTHEPDTKMSGSMAKLTRLDGAEFEIAFMHMMVKHHEGAIKESEKCLDKAYHGELLSMCEDIRVTQTAEIEQMQTWLCEWYGMCPKTQPES